VANRTVAAMPNDLDTYLPIADHGVIGDLRTVALVGSDDK
jgi:hypothetical protein